MSFTVATAELEEVKIRLAKLATRCAKMGLEFVPAMIVTDRIVPVTTKNTVEKLVHDIDFNFDEIKLPGGWTFVATIEHGPAGNVVHSFEGAAETPVEYRTDDPTCDHCNIVRDRVNTIVVLNDEGDFKRVGTTCSSSYLGIDSAKLIPFWEEVLSFSDDDDFFGGSRASADPTIHCVLSAAMAMCRLDGFKPASFGGDSSKVAVGTMLFPTKKDKEIYGERWAKARDLVKDDDVDNALAWLAAEPAGEGTYISNLKAVVGIGSVSGRNMGLAVSLAGVWLRKAEEIEEAKRTAALPPSEHLGEVKERKEFRDGKVVYSRLSEGYSYNDPDSIFCVILFGSDVVWISTSTGSAVGRVLDNLEDDETVSFKATIKALKTDKNDKKVTVVTRAAII